ncbi:MAG: ATP-binding cassette domain-containing protein [Planktomarina sp.]
MSALIDIKGVAIERGKTTVLHGVDLQVQAGEIITIVGPNGSGKSTLLKAIIGALPIASGTLTKAKGLRLGYVPQKLHIDPNLPMTVKRFMRLSSNKAVAEIEQTLIRTGAAHLMDRSLADLSGGQMQRVLLARALQNDPQILLLDEPTTGLDQPGSAQFYQLIADVRQDTGCAVVMVSHELHVVMAASDRVICLNGHICCQGAPEQVISAPEYRALFGTGTKGALALYRHEHDHGHEGCNHDA